MENVLVITGGSRGIGAATALLGAAQGYKVAINFRENENAAKAIVDKIVGGGGEAVAVKGDIAEEKDVAFLFEEVDRKLGRVSALVNNAGILHLQSPVVGMDKQRLRRIFDVNVIGPFLCSIEAIKRMSTKNGGKGGSIVNVSSNAVRQGSPFEYVDYAASKGALDVFTAGLSREVAGEGIRVNSVRPGTIYTDIHASGGEPGRVERVKANIPLGRGGEPEEIAKAILWLISSDASYCTGSVLDVTGGR